MVCCRQTVDRWEVGKQIGGVEAVGAILLIGSVSEIMPTESTAFQVISALSVLHAYDRLLGQSEGCTGTLSHLMTPLDSEGNLYDL